MTSTDTTVVSTRIPFHLSMKGRLLLYLLLPTLIIFGATFAYWGSKTVNLALQSNQTELMQQAQIMASALDSYSVLAINTAQTMALAQQAGMFGQRETSSEYAKSILHRNPNLTAAYFGYEPDADQSDQRYLQSAPAQLSAALGSGGRFLPYWHRSATDNAVLRLEPMVAMETNAYYQQAKAQAFSGVISGVITEPYWYEGTRLIEFTYPIVIDDNFVGIAGVDISLDDMSNDLPNLGLIDDLLLLSAQRQVIASSQNAELQTLQLADTPYAALAEQLQQRKLLTAAIAGQTEKIYTAVTLANSGWLLIVGMDKQRVLGPVYAQFYLMFALAIVALLLVTVASLWFAGKLSERLNSSVKVLAQLAKGELNPHLHDADACRDEIGVMYQSFRHLVIASQNFEKQCSRIASGDYSMRVIARSKADSLAYAINTMADKRQQAEDALRQQQQQLLLTQKELVEAEKLASLGNLVAGVAHEVNTPLGIAVTAASHINEVSSGLLQHLESQTLKRSDLTSGLADVVQGAALLEANLQRAADLIRSFKKVAVDQTAGDERQVVISDYLRDVLKSFAHQLKRSVVQVQILAADDEPTVLIEPGVLAQIYSNLLLNSLIHGFNNGEDAGYCQLQIRQEPNTVVLDYSDNGAGMEAETVKRIFEPFFTTKRGKGGSGLGMHIVYNLVTLKLKGKIDCSSAPGKGVHIVIRFPLQRQPHNQLSRNTG
ncbi:MAG TPA: ATP-binding protein [Rheinheimera sp.]|nr:ATP-binding protein [Rheinheimera sp.]